MEPFSTQSAMDQTLGVWLRETREAKGSSLEEAAVATRIRPRFLVMMEDGDFAAFPGGELQIRGFLRVVSRYLELSADEVLARYDAEVRGIEPDVEADAPLDPEADPEPSRAVWHPLGMGLSPWGGRRGAVTTGLIWGAVLIVMIGIGASIALLLTQGGGDSSAAFAAISTPTPTQPVEAPAEPVEPTLADPAEGVTVSLDSAEHVWVRVTVDNRIAHVGFLGPNEVKTWSGDEEILVETGNGAALEATVNDRLVGPLGGRGSIVRRAWAPMGEIEPA